MKKSPLLSLLLTGVFLSGCSFSEDSQKKEYSHEENIKTDQKNVYKAVQSNAIDYALSNIKDKYISDTGFQQCMSQASNKCLANVVVQKVQKEKNPDLCKDIILDKNRSDCQRVYTTQLAKEQQTPELCETIENIKDINYCRSEFIIPKGIENTSVAECSKLGTFKNMCISSIIEALISKDNNTKWCDLYPSEAEKKSCTQRDNENIFLDPTDTI